MKYICRKIDAKNNLQINEYETETFGWEVTVNGNNLGFIVCLEFDLRASFTIQRKSN